MGIIDVAFVTLRRTHLVYMAEYVNSKPDMEVILYTVLPKRRCRDLGYHGKVISLAFPIGLLLLILQWWPKMNPYRRSNLNYVFRTWFDRIVSFIIRPCDILFSYNGQAVYSSSAAHNKYKAITICYQGSSHILTQTDVRKTYTTQLPSKDSIEYMLQHYENSDFLFAISQYVANSDIRNGVDPKRIRILIPGVDTKFFKPTRKPGNDSYDVLMVGSWWKHKGCDMLLNACLDILKVKLLHVGSVIDCPIPEGPLFKHIDHVPESELPNYYAQAKVFANPSLDEGFGNVYIQAAECGLPIVGSSRCGALDMSLLNGYKDSVFIVNEPLCPESIAKAIQKALDYANHMPSGFRETISDNQNFFTREAASERLYNLLHEVLSNKEV